MATTLCPTDHTVAGVEDLTRTLLSRGSSAQTLEAKVFKAPLVETADPPSGAAVQRELAAHDPQCTRRVTPTCMSPRPQETSGWTRCAGNEEGQEMGHTRTGLEETQYLSYQPRNEPAKEMGKERTRSVDRCVSKVSW